MPVPEPTTDLPLDEIDLGRADTWVLWDLDAVFAKLRRERPVSWHDEPEIDTPGIEVGPGFWALTRYADVMHVSRHPEMFHLRHGASNIGDMPARDREWLGSMINMDAPKHTKLRLIVNRGFTPRQVARSSENVREQAREIVDRVADSGGECDFVERDRGGAPAADHLRHDGHPASETQRDLRADQHRSSASAIPSTCTTLEELMGAGMELFQYGSSSRKDRLDNPRDDITTTLMQAEIEDENGCTAHAGELGSFFLLLVVGGQRDDAQRDQPRHAARSPTTPSSSASGWPTSTPSSPTAVEEIVRWATPVIHFRRTAVDATPSSAARRSRPARRS